MSRHRDEMYIGHMRDACARVERFLSGVSWDAFADNEEKQSAVIRQLEIIGEAGGKVSEGYRSSHPDIPWRAVKDVRNQLIHGYAHVNLRTVWTIASSMVPTLHSQLQAALSTTQEPRQVPPSSHGRHPEEDRGVDR